MEEGNRREKEGSRREEGGGRKQDEMVGEEGGSVLVGWVRVVRGKDEGNKMREVWEEGSIREEIRGGVCAWMAWIE